MPMCIKVRPEMLETRAGLKADLLNLVLPNSKPVAGREFRRDKQHCVEAKIATCHEDEWPQDVHVLHQVDHKYC